MTQDDDIPPFDGLSRRLWTPWRMSYVGGGAKETGCIFCNRIAADDDVESLILHRSSKSAVIVNLYPYNTGHLMIVPNQHVASPEEIDPHELSDMATILPPVLRALRQVLDCHGFNVGMNIGSVAGAGVAEHLHEHVVPRWNGDANFMPIIGAAMIIPELIPVSYAKIRAELQRELGINSVDSIDVVVFDPHASQVLLEGDGALPSVPILSNRSIWRQVIDYVATRGIKTEIAGWAGTNRAEDGAESVLVLFADNSTAETGNWIDLSTIGDTGEAVQRIVTRGLAQLSPIVAPGRNRATTPRT